VILESEKDVLCDFQIFTLIKPVEIEIIVTRKGNEMDKNLLDIDNYALDTEWIRQPTLFFEYAEQLTDARNELDEAKSRLEVAKAELDEVCASLDTQIRSNPESFGVTSKITETVVKNTVLLHADYKKAKKKCEDIQEEILQTKYNVDILQAFVSSLDVKKTALENLVKLHGQNYFATPKINDNQPGQDFIDDALKKSARRKIKKYGKADK
jgi:chromosome segregation ATPase